VPPHLDADDTTPDRHYSDRCSALVPPILVTQGDAGPSQTLYLLVKVAKPAIRRRFRLDGCRNALEMNFNNTTTSPGGM
jgi:hypothetical protein